MKRLLLFVLLFFLAVLGHAQKGIDKLPYRNPIDLPLYLSATFAELRADHFHSGIDLRTGGAEGHPVYAIADGFVSRVAVSPVGFGKAIYIDHPSTGHTSVYAHLRNFNAPIARWVKERQYEKESFALNIYTEKDLFPVKRGDLIGYSGNSGSSGGPHLHFEIRDAATQHILNPLRFGYAIKDLIRPSITRLAVYPEGRQSELNGKRNAVFREVIGSGLQHKLKTQSAFAVSGSVSFGISTYDTGNDVPNKNGVYSIELFLNKELFFEFKADRFSFDETRYINSLIDYNYYQERDSRLVRSKLDPLNSLSMLGKQKSKGELSLLPGDTVHALYVVKDFNGNESRLPFVLVGVEAGLGPEKMKPDTNVIWVEAGKAKRIHQPNVEARFPAETFYRDEEISLKSEKALPGQLSEQISIGRAGIPAHKNYDLRIKLNDGAINSRNLLVVHLHKGKKSPVGGKFDNGWMSLSTRKLGTFVVMADSIKPELKALNFVSGNKVDTLKLIKFSVKDDFSGVDKIQPKLNGKWVLMDYDPKNNLLTYEVDERLLEGRNLLEISVTDQCGNRSFLEVVVNR